MRSQSAIRSTLTTITRPITVAAGVFAPGHLGELTRIIPFEMVDAVLAETGRRERRLRVLPSRVGLYFVLALALLPSLGYRGVWARLTSALEHGAMPTAKALRDVRRRLGPAPLRSLFAMLAGPLGRPRTEGVKFAGYRTVSFDGCRSLKVPDSRANQAWLGKLNAPAGTTGYPVIQLMTLVETGTRALIGAAFGTPAEGELTWAARLLDHLNAGMLVLADRGFDAAWFLGDLHATGASFLVRIKAGRRLPVIARLPDGSTLSIIGGVKVRIITASVQVTCADGTSYGDSYRLVTTLTDPDRYPARALTGLYHERWEHEITYLGLRHTLLGGRVLRSKDPTGLTQEIWALLSVYQALRIAVVDAVSTVPGTDPDRVSFALAVQTAQDLVTSGRNVTGDATDLVGEIGQAVLQNLNPPRRPRVCPRRVKSPISRWNKHPPNRPTTTRRITAITVRRQPTATHQQPDLTPAPDP